MSHWLDGLVGWSKDFNSIETCFPFDPAVDKRSSNIDKFYEDNFDMKHLKFKKGQVPEMVIINLPTSSQLAYITPILSNGWNGDSSSMYVASLETFSMCVEVPNFKSANHQIIRGFPRLPESFMQGLQSSGEALQFIGAVSHWCVNKCFLSDAEKKS